MRNVNTRLVRAPNGFHAVLKSSEIIYYDRSPVFMRHQVFLFYFFFVHKHIFDGFRSIGIVKMWCIVSRVLASLLDIWRSASVSGSDKS